MREKISIIADDEHDHQAICVHLLSIGYNPGNLLKYSSLAAFEAAMLSTDLLLVKLTATEDAFFSQAGPNIYHTVKIPVLLISNHSGPAYIKKLLGLGIQDYLEAGTYDAAGLHNAIQLAIERNSSYYYSTAGDKRIFYESPTPMMIYDVQSHKILDVNNAAIDNYGYSRKEFVGKSIFEIRPTKEIPILKQLLGFKKPQKTYFDAGINRHQKKDGTIFYVHVYTHDIVEHGANARLVIGLDVDKKVWTEQENKTLSNILEQQKLQYESILATLSEVVWSMRADNYELIYVNEACTQTFGYTPQEMLTDKSLTLGIIHPDDREIIIAGLQQTIATGKSGSVFRIVRKDGTIRYLSGVSAYNKSIDGAPDTISGLSVDITEKTYLENKIRENEQNLSAIINNTKDIIWSIDQHYNVIVANEAYYARVREIADKTDYADVKEQDIAQALVQEWQGYYKRAFSGEQFKIVFESSLNGKLTYELINFNPIVDTEGNITGVNFFSRDITEEKSWKNRSPRTSRTCPRLSIIPQT